MILSPSANVNCQWFLSKRCDLKIIFIVYARNLTDLTLCRFCASKHRYFEFMSVISMSCQEDRILWDSSLHSNCCIIFTSSSCDVLSDVESRVLIKMLCLRLKLRNQNLGHSKNRYESKILNRGDHLCGQHCVSFLPKHQNV